MYSIVFLAIVSFLWSLLLTPIVRDLFRRWGAVSQPGDPRNIHDRPIPRVGGVAIALSYALAFACLFAVKLRAGSLIREYFDLVERISPAAIIIFGIGLVDDLAGLKPSQKLLGEIIAGGFAWWAGIRIEAVGGFHFAPWLGPPLTILWVVACTNAINLIDGIDGLAAGIGLFATCTSLISALMRNEISFGLAVVPLAGCLLGFLRYNFNPATIFLGDSGSLLIGFLLGCFGVVWSQKASTMLGMTAPLIALSVPLLDTTLAITRRFLNRKPIFAADRGHIHHRLLDRGLTQRKVALTLYACSAIGAVCSIVMSNQNITGVVVLVFCLMMWVGIQQLGYVEFRVAGHMLMEGAFRGLLKAQIALWNYQDQLSDAVTPDEVWRVIEALAKEFGFVRAHMSYIGEIYDWQNSSNTKPCWDMTIPLAGPDYLRLARPFDAPEQPYFLALADVMRKTLLARPECVPVASLRVQSM